MRPCLNKTAKPHKLDTRSFTHEVIQRVLHIWWQFTELVVVPDRQKGIEEAGRAEEQQKRREGEMGFGVSL